MSKGDYATILSSSFKNRCSKLTNQLKSNSLIFNQLLLRSSKIGHIEPLQLKIQSQHIKTNYVQNILVQLNLIHQSMRQKVKQCIMEINAILKMIIQKQEQISTHTDFFQQFNELQKFASEIKQFRDSLNMQLSSIDKNQNSGISQQFTIANILEELQQRQGQFGVSKQEKQDLQKINEKTGSTFFIEQQKRVLLSKKKIIEKNVQQRHRRHILNKKQLLKHNQKINQNRSNKIIYTYLYPNQHEKQQNLQIQEQMNRQNNKQVEQKHNN